MQATTIEHLGRIDEVTDNDIIVTIVSKSACSGCHARSACSVADTQEKTIVISKPTQNYIVGENVKVIIKESLGFKALTYGYLLPMMLVIISLFVFSALEFSEAIAGLFSLLTLVPYYIIIRLFRQKLSKQFAFSIDKIY